MFGLVDKRTEAAQQLGNAIRQRRKSFGVTQRALAEMCDLAPNTIIQLERGTGNARLTTLLRITGVLGLDLALRPQDLRHA